MTSVHRDKDWMLDLSEKVACLTQVDEVRNAALLHLEPVFKAHKSNFFLVQRGDNSLSIKDAAARGIEKKYFDYFEEHYYRMDPFINAISAVLIGPKTVYTTDQLVPYEEYVKTEYYNEFIKPQDIYAELVVYLTSGTRLLGVMSFFRPRGRPVFSEEDRVNARRAAPYLCATLGRALALEEASQKDVVIRSILAGLPHKGVVLMDHHLEPVYVSETARNMLSLLSSEPACGSTATRFQMPLELRQRLEECKKALPGEGAPEADERRFELPIKNKAHHISAGLRFVSIPRQRPFFVLMLESLAPDVHVVQHLRERGLTKRETDVVFLVCEGLSNARISEKLFISEYTVVNHIRSIYEKLGVNNRTSLAHYVTVLLLRASGTSLQSPSGP
jgi:DNA-binding CsgD family transcriptional regulator